LQQLERTWGYYTKSQKKYNILSFIYWSKTVQIKKKQSKAMSAKDWEEGRESEDAG
jgi:hypothetical protein